MKYGITFPVYVSGKRHWEILCDFLNSIKTKHQVCRIAIINHIDKLFVDLVREQLQSNKCIVLENPLGNSVSGAWNTGIKKAFEYGCEYVMVPNVDIVMHPECINNLIDFYENNKNNYGIWCARPLDSQEELNNVALEDKIIEQGIYSFFSVSKKNMAILHDLEKEGGELFPGYFDMNFTPAYFEDNDYDRRLYVANLKPGTTYNALYWHLGSQTIKNDEHLRFKNRESFEKNKRYFNNKWNTIVKGSPEPYKDNGNVGAFGKAGHLIGNFNLLRNKITPEKTDYILKNMSSDIIDCMGLEHHDLFFLLYNLIKKDTVELIINERQKNNGALLCAMTELKIKFTFKGN